MFRSFDGVDDRIIVSAGTPTTFPFGTAACVLRRGAIGAWHGLIVSQDGGGNAIFAFEFDDTNHLWATWVNGTGSATGATFTSTSDILLAVVGKATGTVAPRFHVYNFTSKTWTHANGGYSEGNGSGTISEWRLGNWQTGDFFNGSLALAAVWDSVTFTDAQIEEMGLHAGFNYWRMSRPTRLWVLDQEATGQNVINDATGGSLQTSVTGTAVDVRSIPQFVGR